MDSAIFPALMFLVAFLTFGVVFVCVTLQAGVRNAALPAMSRTTFFLAASVVTVLVISGTVYSSYVMRRTASSATVDPPKQPPEVPGRAK